MIQNYINLNNSTSEDFWLHRYSSAEHLEKIFKNGYLNLRFTTAMNFEDPYEGWGIENLKQKEVFDLIVRFYNRAIGDGAVVEGLSNSLSCMSRIEMTQLPVEIEKFKLYNDFRSTTFINCWFKSDTLEDENRAMWKLYGNNDNGIRISVKWSDLKNQLSHYDEVFDAGFIDYGNQNKLNNLFFVKDKSYWHEREFRLTLNNQNNKEAITIPLDLEKIYCVVRSRTNRNEIWDRLGTLGFENYENVKWVKKDSVLSFETSQVDWSEVLEIVQNEINQRQ